MSVVPLIITRVLSDSASTAHVNRWQERSWAVAAIGGVVAALLAIYQAFQSLIQRRRELRWKQADLARSMVDSWTSAAAAGTAFRMLRERSGKFVDQHTKEFDVSISRDLPAALELRDSAERLVLRNQDERSTFIRAVFDDLWFSLERAEQSIEIEVAVFPDFQPALGFYSKELAAFKPAVIRYLNYRGYQRASAFLDRFSSWKQR